MSRIREQGSGVLPGLLDQEEAATALPAEWRLTSFVELGALPGAVPCARLHARQVVWEWGLGALTGTVELVASELVTNSVQASEALAVSRYDGSGRPETLPIRLWLQSDGQHVLIHVWDGAPDLPLRQAPDLDAEHGRGLLLVEAMSERYGSYLLESGNGKVVWALCTE